MTDAIDVYGKTKIVGEVSSNNKTNAFSIVGPETGSGGHFLTGF